MLTLTIICVFRIHFCLLTVQRERAWKVFEKCLWTSYCHQCPVLRSSVCRVNDIFPLSVYCVDGMSLSKVFFDVYRRLFPSCAITTDYGRRPATARTPSIHSFVASHHRKHSSWVMTFRTDIGLTRSNPHLFQQNWPQEPPLFKDSIFRNS